MTSQRRFLQGQFVPTNPKKYIGKVQNIVFRSSWELRIMRFLDAHPSIIWWNSEDLKIPYLSPIDNQMHNYHPDFIINVRKKDGSSQVIMLEVKPDSQTSLRQAPKVQTEKYLIEVATYAKNCAKWQAAAAFCEKHNWVFKLLTEKDVPAFVYKR